MGLVGGATSSTTRRAISSSAISGNPSSRYKREDYPRTKHDSSFSKWQILIGPSDWENYIQGKDGAERYRIQNLPTKSAPGIYEIGVAVLISSSGNGGREVGKLEPERVVVVYLGQAENVRSRLQKYGRGGAHLEDKYSLIGVRSSDGVSDFTGGHHKLFGGTSTSNGLFIEVFSRGYPIVYRWAPMSSKSEAEMTEAKLLSKFDYPWNKVSNGARRPNDVLYKINKISSKSPGRIPRAFKFLQSLKEEKVGVPIKASKPVDGSTLYSDDESPKQGHKFFTRVFKFGRSQPRLKSDKLGGLEYCDSNHVSSVRSKEGLFCKKCDKEGRKIDAEHNGMIDHSSISASSLIIGTGLTVGVSCDEEKIPINSNGHPVGEDSYCICGVILHDGSPCRVQPVRGRKRCEEHKGQRIQRVVLKTNPTGLQRLQRSVISETNPDHKRWSEKETLADLSELNRLSPQSSLLTRSIGNASNGPRSCGVVLEHGMYCMSQPAAGRKRCEEHKGMRVNGYITKLASLKKL